MITWRIAHLEHVVMCWCDLCTCTMRERKPIQGTLRYSGQFDSSPCCFEDKAARF